MFAARRQLRRTRHARRVLAALTGAWLVLCGVLCTRHEAHHAHYIDSAGGLRHATHLDGHEVSDHVHLHDASPHGDNDLCGLSAHLRTPFATGPSYAPTARGADALDAPEQVAALPTATAALVYRLAPKTSPPLA